MLITTMCPVAAAQDQPPIDADRPVPEPLIVLVEPEGGRSTEDQRRADMLSRLITSRLTVAIDEVPAREAVRKLQEQLDTTIVGRWQTDPIGHGLDPAIPVTIHLTEAPAVDVLKSIIEQCALFDQATWQIRSTFIEIGTKQRLAVPSARELRIYEITDLLLQPPTFAGDPLTGRPMTLDRKTPREIAADLMTVVSDAVEPIAWEEPSEEERDAERGRLPHLAKRDPSAPAGNPADARPSRNLDPDSRDQLYVLGRWATMHFYDGKLIINAPDFVHRAVAGYQPPAPPSQAPADDDPAADDETASRP
jgi:hypothetical protein